MSILSLDPGRFLRKGGRRLVFEDPRGPDRLIKVLRPDKYLTRNSRVSRFRSLYRIYQQEIGEYLSLRGVCSNDPPLVAPFYGLLETNLGLGMEVARIANRDGELAPTLDDLIRLDSVTNEMRAGVDRLAWRLSDLGVVVSDFKSHNLALLPDGFNFCLVDGLGEKLFLSLRPYCKAFSRLSLEQARRRLQQRIDRRIFRADRVRDVASTFGSIG